MSHPSDHLDYSIAQTKDALNTVSATACLAKWKYSTIHLHNGNTQSCHHVKSESFLRDPNNPSSLHNSPQKIKARAKMLKGARPKECQYCWNLENQNQDSDRILKSASPVYMDFFKETFDSGLGQNISPSFLEVAFDNICQMSCLYCHPAYSSSWQADIDRNGQYPGLYRKLNSFSDRSRALLKKQEQQKNIEQFWQWWPELRHSLRFLKVTGGEPLLSPHFQKLLDHLSAESNTELNFGFNSNFSVPTKTVSTTLEKVQTIAPRVASMNIFTSIDGTGPQAEYIRHGLDENLFWHNCRLGLDTLQRPTTWVFIVTISALNLFSLKGLLEKISALKKQYPKHRVVIDTPYLRHPGHLSVEILPKEFRGHLESCLDLMKSDNSFSAKEIHNLSRVLPLVGGTTLKPWSKALLRRDLALFIDESDRRKNTSFSMVFPELAIHKKRWKHLLS